MRPLSLTGVSQAKSSDPHTSPILTERAGQRFLSQARDSLALLSGVLAIIHPEQYRMGLEIQREMKASGSCVDALTLWPSVFTAATIVTNQKTPFHRDILTDWSWFDLILSFGLYHHAPLYIPILGIRVNNPRGTICAFSGKALLHGVRKTNLARISFILYMRKNVQEGQRVKAAGWMTQQYYEGYVGTDRRKLRRKRRSDEDQATNELVKLVQSSLTL